jgi:hypothetical protein
MQQCLSSKKGCCQYCTICMVHRGDGALSLSHSLYHSRTAADEAAGWSCARHGHGVVTAGVPGQWRLGADPACPDALHLWRLSMAVKATCHPLRKAIIWGWTYGKVFSIQSCQINSLSKEHICSVASQVGRKVWIGMRLMTMVSNFFFLKELQWPVLHCMHEVKIWGQSLWCVIRSCV